MSSLRDVYNRIAKVADNPSFLLAAAMGNIPGVSTEFAIGNNPSMAQNTKELIWGHDGGRTPIPAAAEVFVNSSDAGDTTTNILCRALDADYNRVTLFATLNGQTQVRLEPLEGGSVPVVYVQSAVCLNNTPAGDVYIALASTITAGVPTTAGAIQDKINQGKNITRTCGLMVPAGKAAITMGLRGTTDNQTKNTLISTEITPYQQAKVISVEYNVNPSFGEYTFPVPVATVDVLGEASLVLPEKTLIEFTGTADTPATKCFFGVDYLIIDIESFGLF